MYTLRTASTPHVCVILSEACSTSGCGSLKKASSTKCRRCFNAASTAYQKIPGCRLLGCAHPHTANASSAPATILAAATLPGRKLSNILCALNRFLDSTRRNGRLGSAAPPWMLTLALPAAVLMPLWALPALLLLAARPVTGLPLTLLARGETAGAAGSCLATAAIAATTCCGTPTSCSCCMILWPKAARPCSAGCANWLWVCVHDTKAVNKHSPAERAAWRCKGLTGAPCRRGPTAQAPAGKEFAAGGWGPLTGLSS